MNGLEAIELMKQGKMIKSGIWIYSMDSDGVIWLKAESNTGWVGAHMFNILANDYEEYIEPKTLTGWERAEEDEQYHAVGCVSVINKVEGSSFIPHVDAVFYESANYFSTEEKAEEINFKQTLFRKLQRFSDENGGNEIDWKCYKESKWIISYDHIDEKLRVFHNVYAQSFGQVYFISKEVADKAIELFHDELIKYFTGDFGGEV